MVEKVSILTVSQSRRGHIGIAVQIFRKNRRSRLRVSELVVNATNKIVVNEGVMECENGGICRFLD